MTVLDPHGHIDSQRLPRRQFGGWNFELGESFGFGRKGIIARLQVHKLKGAILIRCGCASAVIFQTAYLDDRAWHKTLGRVMHYAHNTAECGLTYNRTNRKHNRDYYPRNCPAHFCSSGIWPTPCEPRRHTLSAAAYGRPDSSIK
jgi:hypothetical protein